MPKSRKERRPRRKARHSSRDGAEPAVFRLPEVSEAARKLSASSAKAAEADVPHAAPGDGDSMAALLDDVAPLRAPERVARAAVRKDENAERRAASRARRELTFVVERDGERVEGYRSDCSRPNVAPGSRRDWVPTHHIDLHGVRIRDLEQRLTRGIRECVERHGFRLLVIHGKGLHSTGGSSVLADAVLESLTSERHARHVRAFSTAPERLGGGGALAVELDVGAR